MPKWNKINILWFITVLKQVTFKVKGIFPSIAANDKRSVHA